MEIFLPAVLGELATRSVSFVINKYSKLPVQAMEINLERILLRAQVIVEEAEGRHITNQGLLRQLRMLRDAMYQGFYVLDTLRFRAFQEDGAGDNKVRNYSWALSKFSYAKRLCLSSSGSSTKASQELVAENVLDNLRTMILDAGESVMFFTSYPRLGRQPYNMHILLGNCMFGRQMEMELILHFLLYTQPCSGRHDRFDVLPIVGPAICGKSTLVAHVCNDERVRDHFSQIAFFRHGTFRDEDIDILTDQRTMRLEKQRKLLIVFEVVGELNDDLWRSLYSLSRKCTTSGSKIIITSRSDKITKLGTTQTTTLKHLPYEAFWYFFKVITFGSTDPKMHPRLAYLAMEISKMMNGSLISANVIGGLLRNNFSIQYWCKILKFLRESVEKSISMHGEHPCDLLAKNKSWYFRRLGTTTEDVFISSHYQTCSSQEELPEITAQDVVYGGVKPQGAFKALAWKSPLPPYRCYINIYEIQQLQTRLVKKRRSE
ncbi:disease resistance protein RGA2-like [Lolium rigidum]|uniref:disease resistance protein RGA2-like n=1 Tax=Lolium rigidum TaxID=89674 RepID=UPI001F5D667A|nr:disease resistance protein RGA2-like [Lolium rigidum]